MSKVIVIGAGASGLIAALKACEKNEVTILEKNDKCGKKLLITGNGRCNFWHDNISIKDYYTDDYNALEKILESKDDTYNFLLSLGIYPKIKDGYYYPYSMQASSVKEILEREVKKRKINVIYDADVIDVIFDNTITVKTNSDILTCDKLILSTGSKAYPKTGSTGFGYELLKKNNFTINEVMPVLVNLRGNENYFKEWNGIRCDAKISLLVNNKLLKTEEGEIQLTDTGVSGICVFNLSSLVSKALYKREKVLVKINFAPFINDLDDFMNKRYEMLNGAFVSELLESVLNYKLIKVMLKLCNINGNSKWNELDNKKQKELINMIQSFNLDINNTGSFDKAQVCTGGISLKEISTSMQSNRIPNLFITGEVLDVDGVCGGYNLAFAFISGFIAGKSV